MSVKRKKLKARKGIKKKSFFSNSLFGGGSTRASAEVRARSPYQNHTWVYAAATQIATVSSQAIYKIFQETPEVMQERKIQEKAFGRDWRGPKAGKERTAIMRYSRLESAKRIFKSENSLIEDFNHPLSILLENPNPIQNRASFDLTTHLWAALRGEFFWIKTGPQGAPIGPTQFPEELWPVSPDCFQQKVDFQGNFLGWEVQFPSYFPSVNRRMFLNKYEVLHCITRPNPDNPLRGMSPVEAVAIAIETDLLSKTHNRSLIENDAIPKGIIVNEMGWADDDLDDGVSEEDFKNKWKNFYEGELKSGRIGFLEGSMKFLPIGLSPQDMQFLEQYKIDRQEVLSAMGVPPSSVGLSEFTNYSTALVQDNTFWQKTILPFLHAEEAAIDRDLLFDQPDNIVGLYDITSIEALRAGISDKIEMAAKMCSDSLHTPPAVAFATVGLQVNNYKGDDTGFVSLALQKVQDALEAVPEVTEAPEPAEAPKESVEEPEVLSEETKKRLYALIYNTVKDQRKDTQKMHFAICKKIDVAIEPVIFEHCRELKDSMTLSEMFTFSRRSVEIFSDLKIGANDA